MNKAREHLAACPSCDLDLQGFSGLNISFCPRCRMPLMLIAEKYRIIKKLGEGGFGTVYLAQHIRLLRDTERVIKVLKPEIFQQHPALKARFEREVQLTSTLSQRNEHIVRIFDDFGEADGLGPYYVMEYLRGKTLADHFPKSRIPSDILCFALFFQLCKAMDAAHREGIVHRDLKPDNLFLIPHEDNTFLLKVIDFGIAKPAEEHNASKPLTQGQLGTPAYMSPEQCMGSDSLDHRADLYSMALILYECLTGHTPYLLPEQAPPQQRMMLLMNAHIYQAPLPLTHYRPDLESTLNDILLTALAKEPEKRPTSVESFWDLLQKALPPAWNLPPLKSSSPYKLLAEEFLSTSLDRKTPTNLPFLQTLDTPTSTPTPHPASLDAISPPPSLTTKAPSTPPTPSPANPLPKDRIALRIALPLVLSAILLALLASPYLPFFHTSTPSKKPLQPIEKTPLQPIEKNTPLTQTPPQQQQKKPQQTPQKDQEKTTPSARKNLPVIASPKASPATQEQAPSLRPRQHGFPKKKKYKSPPNRRLLALSQRPQPPRSPTPPPAIPRLTQPPPQEKPAPLAPTRPKLAADLYCPPPTAALLWIFASLERPQQAEASIQFTECNSCRWKKARNGYCLGIRKDKKRTRVRIVVNNYQTCSHWLTPQRRAFSWYLKPDEPDALVYEQYNCTR